MQPSESPPYSAFDRPVLELPPFASTGSDELDSASNFQVDEPQPTSALLASTATVDLPAGFRDRSTLLVPPGRTAESFQAFASHASSSLSSASSTSASTAAGGTAISGNSALFYSVQSHLPPLPSALPTSPPSPTEPSMPRGIRSSSRPLALSSHPRPSPSNLPTDVKDTFTPTPLFANGADAKSSASSKTASPFATAKKKPPLASIYAEAPALPPLSQFPAPQKQTKQQLYEKLLPDPDPMVLDPEQVASYQQNREMEEPANVYQDRAFAILYWLSLTLMLVLGLVYVFLAKSDSVEFHKTLSYAIQKASGTISAVLLVAFVIGMAWILLLRHNIRLFMWLSVAMIPVTLSMMAIWCIDWARRSTTSVESTSAIFGSLVALVLAAFSTFTLYHRRHRIQKSIELAEFAIRVLAENPSIFLISLGIYGVYFLFYLIWLYMFGRIATMGYLETQTENDGHVLRQWVPEPSSRFVLIFFVFMHIWTVAVISYVEQCTIYHVVCEWYFRRADRQRNQRDRSRQALRSSLTFHFGSIALAALLVSIIRFTQFMLRSIKRMTRRRSLLSTGAGDNELPSFPFSGLIWGLLRLLEGAVEGISTYALVYVAYSGRDFCTCAKMCANLFRRHASTLLTDLSSKWIFQLGIGSLYLLSFMVTFNITVSFVSDPSYAWFVALIGSILPFQMVRFCTYIVLHVVDAIFVCYTVDMDTAQCHSIEVHEIFRGARTEHVVWESV